MKLFRIIWIQQHMSMLILVSIVSEITSPAVAYALTSGPTQPEVQSFQPIGASDMVDLFSGDFSYNIPLVDVGGYPLNIHYSAGVTMDQEASWVGLGWNLNPGVVNRNMRGLPDDFNGEEDEVKKEVHMKPNRTITISANTTSEIFGYDAKGHKIKGEKALQVGGGHAISNNNYDGWSISSRINPQFTSADEIETGFDFSYGSRTGISVDPSIGINLDYSIKKEKYGQKSSFQIGSGINSREGLKTMSLSMTNKNLYHAERRSDGSGSANWNFGTQTYTPRINNESRQSGFNLNYTLGSALLGLHNNMRLGGSINTVSTHNITKLPSYGFMYEDHTNGNETVLLDFNREFETTLNDNSRNLPVTNHTFDIFSVTGQGVGGSYRTYRSDIGKLHDHKLVNKALSVTVGSETGAGNLTHLGLNLGANYTKTTYGPWSEDNLAFDKFGFVSNRAESFPDFESHYFKPAGEQTMIDGDFFNLINGYKPVRVELNNRTGNATNTLRGFNQMNKAGVSGSQAFSMKDSAEGNTRNMRDPRNRVMSVLTNAEANFCFEGALYSYDINAGYGLDTIAREYIALDNRPKHHIREVSILNTDGSRYIYGIPAYNHKQIEYTFNISKNNNSHITSQTCLTGDAVYSTESGNADNSMENKSGEDEFYMATHTRSYAHSFLLTSVLSADYVDVKNDGITDDDLGTAVKFNYSRTNTAYNWRTPYGNNTANYQEGLKSKNTDDKGSYIYGEKEVWHLHSIESKNQVALFKISEREDGRGVIGNNGGLSTETANAAYKLDRIELYNKQDLISNGINAEPIKIVYFEFDYTLCPNVHNNSGAAVAGNENKGKLTLRKIYFSYGKSNKAKFSPYRFNYSEVNPAYATKNQDIWGTYKPQPTGATCGYAGPVLNAEFPYTTQNKVEADSLASAWALREIFLPSGGKIQVQYEADDYGYVQDRKAMSMCKIKGFGRVENGALDAPENRRKYLHNARLSLHQNAILFELKQVINTGNTEQNRRLLFENYLKDLDEFQVTVFVDIDGNNNYEYVKCYIEANMFAGYGVTDGGHTGWFALKTIKFGDRRLDGSENVNPVSRAAWNFTRLNCDYLVNPPLHLDGANNPAKVKLDVRKMYPFLNDLSMLFGGYNKNLFHRNFSSTFIGERSWIRLQTPGGQKLGGGHRVKKVVINDNWSEMGSQNTAPQTMEYGQSYEYTTTVNGVEISSGVAANEPSFSDENPLRASNSLIKANKLVPDELVLLETPVGASFYPGASVGYAKVRVRSIGRSNVQRTAPGSEVSEFYTAKDFPTKVFETDLQLVRKETNKLLQLVSFKVNSTISASQGYSIVLNDMHGKPKAQFKYIEGAEKPYSGVRYMYKVSATDSTMLDNHVPVVEANGVCSVKPIGIDFDMVHDMNEFRMNNTDGGLGANSDVFFALISAIVIPGIQPRYRRNVTKVRTIITTKVINQYAIQTGTVAYQEGSVIATKNLLWDARTGAVLLSSVGNEFSDNIYNFTYPAHWAYNGMGPAYLNTGLVVNNVVLYQDSITFPAGLNVNNYLVPGDELIVYNLLHSNGPQRAWVYDGSDGVLNLIDQNGEPLLRSNIYPMIGITIKVIRSGRRNQQATSIGSVATLSNPIHSSSLVFDNVLNAEAVEFSDQWQTHLNYIPRFSCPEGLNDTAIELIQLLNYLGANNKLRKYFTIQTQPLDGFYVPFDSVFRVNGETLIYQGRSNDGAKVEDTCQDYKVKLSWNNNEKVDMYHFREYTAAIDTLRYRLKYVPISQGIPLAEEVSGNWVWTPEWLGTSTYLGNIFDSLESKSLHMPAETEGTQMILRITDGCVLYIQADKPFTELFELFSMQAVNDNEIIGFGIIRGDSCHYDTAQIQLSSSCFNLSRCYWNCRNVFKEEPVNPFLANMRGVWRPKRQLKYLENRQYQTSSVNTQTDGQYASFSPYWQYSGASKRYLPTSNSKWIWATEVSKYSPFGPELETRDALGRYSSALYGYNYTHPVAVASNSRYNQIAFDGFEDYHYQNELGVVTLCQNDHFNYKNAIGMLQAELDHGVSHSGNSSLKVFALGAAAWQRQIRHFTVEEYSAHGDDIVRIARTADDIGYFAPNSDNTVNYIVGGWVRSTGLVADTAYTALIRITCTDSIGTGITTFDAHPSGYIIEGWQRIEAQFPIPAGTTMLKIELVAEESESWFDDVRIHPADGNMLTYVYDSRTLRLMAELDANNYATFYEYNKEGALMRQKKETVKGIQTLKEIQAGSLKKPNTNIFNP